MNWTKAELPDLTRLGAGASDWSKETAEEELGQGDWQGWERKRGQGEGRDREPQPEQEQDRLVHVVGVARLDDDAPTRSGPEECVRQAARSILCVPTQRVWPWHPPVHMVLVSIVNVVLFYAINDYRWLALYVPMASTDAFKVVTLILSHADAVHLWGNVFGTLTLCAIFEVIHGTPRAALIYWVGGVFGSIAEVVLWERRAAYLLGASGAVYAVVAAYAAHLLMNWTETPLRWIWLVFATIIAVIEIATASANPAPNVAYAAHGYGALFGVCLGIAVVRNVRVLRCERVLALTATLATLVGAIVLLVALSFRVAQWEIDGLGGAPPGLRPTDGPW